MWCENWNFDNNTECVSKTPIRSAEDFAESVNRGRELRRKEKNDPNIIPTESDFDKAFGFRHQSWPQLWNWYNPNASINVTVSEKKILPQTWVNVWSWVTTWNINQNNPSWTINIWVQR